MEENIFLNGKHLFHVSWSQEKETEYETTSKIISVSVQSCITVVNAFWKVLLNVYICIYIYTIIAR